jgi:hypothetical protein
MPPVRAVAYIPAMVVVAAVTYHDRLLDKCSLSQAISHSIRDNLSKRSYSRLNERGPLSEATESKSKTQSASGKTIR